MYSRHALFLIGSQFKNNIAKIPWLLNYPICTHWHSVLVFVMDLLKILVYTSLQYLYTHRTHLCINPYNTVLLWQQFVRYPICDATRCDETSLNTGLILLKPPLRTGKYPYEKNTLCTCLQRGILQHATGNSSYCIYQHQYNIDQSLQTMPCNSTLEFF